MPEKEKPSPGVGPDIGRDVINSPVNTAGRDINITYQSDQAPFATG